MAIRTICGFSTGDANNINAVQGGISFVSTVFDQGDFCMRANSTDTGLANARLGEWLSTSGVNDLAVHANSYCSFLFRVDTAPASGDEEVYTVRDGANAIKLQVRIDSARNLVVYDKDLSVVATGATVLALTTQYHIAVRSGNGTTAAYEVKINGVSELSGTCNQLATDVERITFGKQVNRNSNVIDYYFGAIIEADDAFSDPDAQIASMLVDGAGNYTAWTGDHTAIDAPPHDGDTSYIDSSTSGQAETFTLESAASAGISGTVLAVLGLAIVRDEGGSSALRYRLRSGSTDSDNSANDDPGSTYVGRGRFRTTDPATSAAWDVSALDSIEIGVLNNANVAARCTFAMVEVAFVPDAGGIIPLIMAHRRQMGVS